MAWPGGRAVQVALCGHSEILLEWISVTLLVDPKAVRWPEVLIHQSSLTVIYTPTMWHLSFSRFVVSCFRCSSLNILVIKRLS